MLKYVYMFFCVFSVLFAEYAFQIDGISFTEKDFFQMYPKNEWLEGDSVKQSRFVKDFLKHELAMLEAKRLGFSNNPEVYKKVFDRSRHLLVNKAYEEFVANPLISQEVLDKTRNNIQRDIYVKHILVGHVDSRLRKPINRTQDEAFLLSKEIQKQLSEDVTSFDVLASKSSDDPSLSQNGGEVGWLSWGQTIPEFQDVAFSLEINSVSSPVLTDFGYHIIVVSNERDSEYAGFSEEELEDVVFEKSRGSVYSQLKNEAMVYDSLQVVLNGVVFDEDVLGELFGLVVDKESQDRFSRGSSNYVNVLLDANSVGVVCVVNGKGFGARWFANKLSRVPSTRRPNIGGIEDLKRTFSVVLLQGFGVFRAREVGLQDRASFQKELRSIKYTIFYDAYLKHLVNSVEKPSLEEVSLFYEENYKEKYMIPEKAVVSEIRSKDKGFIDSLSVLISGGKGFDVVFESSKPYGRVLEPFARGKYNTLGEFAFSSQKNTVSGVIENLNQTYSIARLDSVVASVPMGVEKAYSRIESLLLKQKQAKAKEFVLDRLLEKYDVKIQPSFYSGSLN